MKKITLRWYQKQAVEAVFNYFSKHREAALLTLPTGAGKTLVIREIALIAAQQFSCKVIILSHVIELIAQNIASFEQKVSVISAGLRRAESQEQIIIASVQSFANFLKKHPLKASLIIVDECHRVSLKENSQYQFIFNQLKQLNDCLILGLTATPYRLDTGWIYNKHLTYQLVRTEKTCFFKYCLYEVAIERLIQENYLTQVEAIQAPVLNLENLEDTQNDYLVNEQAILHAKPFLKKAKGTLIFCQTLLHLHLVRLLLIKHAIVEEDQVYSIDSVTSMQNRCQAIEEFKAQKIKILLNVNVLTTGFDAPHIDLIVMLRATESVSLFQQMVGRGLRLFPNKAFCLLLDYAGNPFDLQMPQLTDVKPKKATQIVKVICPECAHQNLFWGYKDQASEQLVHYGRRCQGLIENNARCNYRFVYKICDCCGNTLDISSKICHACHHLVISPDKQLRLAQKNAKQSIYIITNMTVESVDNQLHVSYEDLDSNNFIEIVLEEKIDLWLKTHGFYTNQALQENNEEQILLWIPKYLILEKINKEIIIKRKIFNHMITQTS